LPIDCDEIRDACIRAGAACAQYQESANSLAETFAVESPTTDHGVDALSRSVSCVLDAPVLDGVNVSSMEWITREPEIRQVIATGLLFGELTLDSNRGKSAVFPVSAIENKGREKSKPRTSAVLLFCACSSYT
jgi:hypothetical protein